MKNSADLLITYDKDESIKYGITYYGNRIYSRLLDVTEPTVFAADVYYIGYVKDRLNTILLVYRTLTQNSLQCRFDLVGVPTEQQEPLSGICYTSKVPATTFPIQCFPSVSWMISILMHADFLHFIDVQLNREE